MKQLNAFQTILVVYVVFDPHLAMASLIKNFEYSGPPVAIPDCPVLCEEEPVSIDIIVSPQLDGVADIIDLNISLLISHPHQGDLRATLRHVDTGHTATLFLHPGHPEVSFGFSANNFGNPTTEERFVLDDEATSAYDPPSVAHPGITNVTGTWLPHSPLTVFDDQSIEGTWRLTVTDQATLDAGTIEKLGLMATVVTAGDFDFNGIVDGEDFLLWQRNPSVGSLADWETNYGTVAPLSESSAAVPEPSAMLSVISLTCCFLSCSRNSLSRITVMGIPVPTELRGTIPAEYPSKPAEYHPSDDLEVFVP